MHNIDTVGNYNGFFRNPIPPDVQGTVLDADWLNAVQGELGNTIESAGITLTKGDNTQLAAAIKALASKPGFRSGLIGSKTGDTELTLSGGVIEIDGVLGILSAPLALTPTLAASNWYQVYVSQPSSGNALTAGDFTVSTDAPAVDDAKGGALYDGDDRWVFSFQTDSSGYIIDMKVGPGGSISFPDRDDSLVISSGSPATTATLLYVSLPPLGELETTLHFYLSSGQLAVADGTDTTANFSDDSKYRILPSGGSAKARLHTNSDRAVYYRTQSPGTLKVYIDNFTMPGLA